MTASSPRPLVLRPKGVWRWLFPSLGVVYLVWAIVERVPILGAVAAACFIAAWNAWRSAVYVADATIVHLRPPFRPKRVRVVPGMRWSIRRGIPGSYMPRSFVLGPELVPAISLELWFWDDLDPLIELVRNSEQPGASAAR